MPGPALLAHQANAYFRVVKALSRGAQIDVTYCKFRLGEDKRPQIQLYEVESTISTGSVVPLRRRFDI